MIVDVTNTGDLEVIGNWVAPFLGESHNTRDLVLRQGSDAVFLDDLTLDASPSVVCELGDATEPVTLAALVCAMVVPGLWRRANVLAIALVVLALPTCVHSQNAAWVNPSGGFYSSGNNWVPSAVPGPNNDILINVGNAYNISFLSDRSANSLSISNNLDLTFSTGGPTSSPERIFSLAGNATIDRSTLTLGDLSQGRPLHLDVEGQLNMTGADLSVLNGAQLDTLPSLASSNSIEGAGSIASQVVVRGRDAAGQSSRWSSGGDINIGRGGGPALMTVADGGQVSSIGGVAIGSAIGADGSLLSVSGTSADGTPSSLASSFFQLGFASGGGGVSAATAQVSSGAQLSTDNVQIFRDSRIVIEREDLNRNPSRWDAGFFDVFGGFVDILSGGQLTSDSANLSQLAIVKVNGVGANGRASRWDINGNLRLGSNQGFGIVQIDSGHVTSDTAEIGIGTGSSVLSIDGLQNANGVWENSGDVFLGGSTTGPKASGDVRLNNQHTRVDIGGTLTVWGPGTVRIDGGEFEADVVDHTHGGVFDFNAGALAVNRFDGDLLNVAGTLAPGVGVEAGATIIDGDYTQQSGGVLTLDIGGAGAGSTHDLVSITGNAQIDGLLEITLNGGFMPDASDEFTMLASGTLIGFFDNINTGQRLNTSDGLGSFLVHYGIGSAFDENRIVLSDFESIGLLPGDYNHDGVVDFVDYAVWREHLGAPAGTLANDIDGGAIGAAQYASWRANFGSILSPLSSISARSTHVPEPTAICLLLASSILPWLRRCRRAAS